MPPSATCLFVQLTEHKCERQPPTCWEAAGLCAHMGAAEISAGEAKKKSFITLWLQKRSREGDYFQNLGYG